MYYSDNNVLPGRSRITTFIRRRANYLRTWYMFSLKYPWIKWGGIKSFVRVPLSTKIWSPHKDITMGDRVQFGPNCRIQCDILFGNEVLIAGDVAFIGRDDHIINYPRRTIWNSGRGDSKKTVVGDDVWIGHGAIIVAGVHIGAGAVVAAGAVVVKDVAPCSVVGGNPAHYIRDRFETEKDKESHLNYLSQIYPKL